MLGAKFEDDPFAVSQFLPSRTYSKPSAETCKNS